MGRLYSITDTGCDLRLLDARFGRCTSCPLPRCRAEYDLADQRAAQPLITKLIAAQRKTARIKTQGI